LWEVYRPFFFFSNFDFTKLVKGVVLFIPSQLWPTEGTDELPVFLFSSFAVENISTTNAAVFDGSGIGVGRDPHLAMWATSIPSSLTTLVLRIG